MARNVVCPDGSVVRGETDDELVAGVEAWLSRESPRLTGTLTRAEILARAVEDEPETRSTAGSKRGR